MLLHGVGEFSTVVLETLLRVTAQDLQTQGDVVDPTPRVDTEVAAEQRRIKNDESFLFWIVVSCEDLRNERGRKKYRNRETGGEMNKCIKQTLKATIYRLDTISILMGKHMC